MNYNNNGLNLGKLLVLGGAIFGAYKLGHYIENTYFKGKTDAEITHMVNNAFEQLNAYAHLAKDGSELLQKAVYNLQNGYTGLNFNQIDIHAVKNLYSVIDSIDKISQGDSAIKEPLTIIDQSLHLLEENRRTGYEV